jgi:hypothetical protein
MDPIRLVPLAMGSGVAFGVAVVTLTVLGVERLRPAMPTSDPTAGPSFYLLVFGTLAGLVFAGVVAWWLLAPVPTTYRRGGLSLVAGFATVIPMLLCMPVNQAAGPAGLAGLAAAALGISLLLGTRARRLGARA